MSDALDRLVRESRPELGTREVRNVDWARSTRALPRVEAERAAERARRSPGGAGRGVGGRRWAALAAAAAVAFVVGEGAAPAHVEWLSQARRRGRQPDDRCRRRAAARCSSTASPRPSGTLLHEGDVVEARGAQATVDRPGKLTLVLERGARATVTHVQGALVLALEEGAVEAQVVPVPNGEAFAVDVGASRVAVHGTHLRVARAGGHVVVDLNEGVVSLGEAPRMGSTLGTLITAPAHAEFTTDEPEARSP